jgi:hypothetical protein
MPWKSKKQQAWGHSEAGQKALGASKIKEFDEATKKGKGFKRLPKKVKKAKRGRNY